jgi:isopenicillin N synthase-like dioxygenase
VVGSINNPTAVPIIDLGPYFAGSRDDHSRVAEQVRQACEHIGFLTVTGHGVPAEQIERTAAVARAFFDLPADEKRRLRLTLGGAGYSPVQGESLAASLGKATPADLKESLNVGADFEATPWPARPAELRAQFIAYFQTMNRLAGDLLRIFASALDLPEDFFGGKIDHSSSFLRVVNYPPQAAEPEPGQLRAGAHTDYGTLTILRSENVAGGLQVQSRAGAWLDVRVAPQAFVVNLGDRMMRWTNDRWVSTPRRVVNPPAELRQAAGGSHWCSSTIPIRTPWWNACRRAAGPTTRRATRRLRPANSSPRRAGKLIF